MGTVIHFSILVTVPVCFCCVPNEILQNEESNAHLTFTSRKPLSENPGSFHQGKQPQRMWSGLCCDLSKVLWLRWASVFSSIKWISYSALFLDFYYEKFSNTKKSRKSGAMDIYIYTIWVSQLLTFCHMWFINACIHAFLYNFSKSFESEL